MQKKDYKKYENIKSSINISSKNIANIIFTILSRSLLFFPKNILKTTWVKLSTIIIFYILYFILLYQLEYNSILKLFPYENRVTFIYCNCFKTMCTFIKIKII